MANLRNAIVTSRDHGASVSQIAEQMGVSRAAVYAMMSRARRSESAGRASEGALQERGSR